MFMFDLISQVKFKVLQPGEDAWFCNLVHFGKQSFNMLKEVWSQNDMDNSHMLSIFEQILCPDDWKIWLQNLEL